MISKTVSFAKCVRDRLFESTVVGVPQYSAYRPIVFFLLAIFSYISYQLLMQPHWVLGGEMWAEMATNYYPNANSLSLYSNFFATDAGYIPLPQRLIAFAGNQLNLPAAAIPYFYTWSAIVLAGIMVGSFCLAQFRVLIEEDIFRFFMALMVLLVVDFETRTFINFTYLSAFFITIVSALALVSKDKNVSWWSWFIPVLMISKPAILATLPFMVAVALVSGNRFRAITIISVALAVVQIFQLYVSQKSGVMPFQVNDASFFAKIFASFGYFFGFIGNNILGPSLYLTKIYSILTGCFLVGLSCILLFRSRLNSSALILAGLSLVFFNAFINCFALSSAWNYHLLQLNSEPYVNRSTIGIYIGSLLLIAGLLGRGLKAPPLFKAITYVLLPLWFVGSGWFEVSGRMNKEPISPVLNNSHWQSVAAAIDSGVSPLCVPINPLGWLYSNGCALLSPGLSWGNTYRYEVLAPVDGVFSLNISVPELPGKRLVSLALMVKPLSIKTTFIDAKAIIELKDGSRKYFTGASNVSISGGLLLFPSKESISIDDIFSIKIVFDSPLEFAVLHNDPTNFPAVSWMGF